MATTKGGPIVCPTGMHELWKKWEAAGLVPPLVTRMVLDFQINETVKVYYECHADKRMVIGKELMDVIDRAGPPQPLPTTGERKAAEGDG